jgi:hypothetical protein
MNVAEKLAREIRRVAELRCFYEDMGKTHGMIVGPARMLMDAALEQACKAAGIDDATVQLAALQSLEGFEK